MIVHHPLLTTPRVFILSPILCTQTSGHVLVYGKQFRRLIEMTNRLLPKSLW